MTELNIEAQIRQAGFTQIAGVDEAGRGACAGPLVAAAVILAEPIAGLADSKRLTAKQRITLFQEIQERALAWSIVEVSAAECDENLQLANISALRRAVLRLDIAPDYVLSDGFQIPGLTSPNLGICKGDQLCKSISAASILAKVHRDQLLEKYHERWPQYGFAKHKGYGTKAHEAAIAAYGVSEIHRLSYANVQRALRQFQALTESRDKVEYR